MKLVSLELDGFRAFAEQATIDLDGDAVLLIGPNGSGKTSLCDGILWGLTGLLPRIADQDGSVVSEYSTSGQARVALSLRSTQGELWRVIRTDEGADQSRLQLETDAREDPLRGADATAELLRLLGPVGIGVENPFEAVANALSRSVYLQQDLVRQFIEADSDRDRFDAVSQLVGTGQVTELQLALEKGKRGWTGATNNLETEIDRPRQRLRYLDTQLSRLGTQPAGGDQLEKMWRGWWESLRDVGLRDETAPSSEVTEAPSAVDEAIRQLSALRSSIQRQLTEARALDEEEIPSPESRAALDERLQDLRKESAEIAGRIEHLRTQLIAAEQSAADERRRQVESRQRREQLAALADLALKHLGDRCPVCDQRHDRPHTVEHLEALIADASTTGPVEGPTDKVTDIANALQELERRSARVRGQLRDQQRNSEELRRRADDRLKRAKDLGVDVNSDETLESKLPALVERLTERDEEIAALGSTGEELALLLARRGEHARRTELERECAELEQVVSAQEAEVASRRESGVLGQQLLDALRDVNSALVERQINKVQPLLDRIYGRIDPHPAFQQIRLHTTVRQGRGRIQAAAMDPLGSVTTDSPAAVFSSSQLNALAVSLFLSLNLGVAALPLQTAILDDPLQSLDDVNLLGLVDLLRRTKSHRQLILSTHEDRFGDLLERKLRPIRDQGRTIRLSFDGWARSGPRLSTQDVEADREPLRIAA